MMGKHMGLAIETTEDFYVVWVAIVLLIGQVVRHPYFKNEVSDHSQWEDRTLTPQPWWVSGQIFIGLS